ncbi:MAG: DUF2029 domain-containing protein [Candidatus Omnitrophica bacterium]|nr:DUF2029 domain-containing protein [Candidatus Omnitrophota bacterium]
MNKEDIYSRPDMSVTPYKYSPMFAFLFSPLTLLPKHLASLIFFTMNFFMVAGICFLSGRIMNIEGLSFGQKVLLFSIPVLFTSRFILLVWDAGQVNILMLFLVVLSLFLLKRNQVILSACCLALSAFIKYMPVLFLPYFVVKKQWKYVAWVMIFMLLFSLIPALYVGLDQEINYLKNWLPFISHTSLDLLSWVDYKNQSLYSTVLRYSMDLSAYDFNYSHSFLNLTFYQGLGTAIVLGFAIYCFALFPVEDKKQTSLMDYSLLFLCMALLNPNAWFVNFVVLLFVYMYLLHYLIKNRFKDKVVLIGGILAFILSSWMSEAIFSEDLERLFEELSNIAIASLILVFLLIRIKFKKVGAAQFSSQKIIHHSKGRL